MNVVLVSSDTRGVSNRAKPTRQHPAAPDQNQAEVSGDVRDGGVFEHLAGVESGIQAGIEAGLTDGLERVGADADLEQLVEAFELGRLSGRRFAHEVNNLVGAISGRAQRAAMSGDPEHVRQAISLAADSGKLVVGLCEMFMVDRSGSGSGSGVGVGAGSGVGVGVGGVGDGNRSDNRISQDLLGVVGGDCVVGLRGAHGYAVDVVGGGGRGVGGFGSGFAGCGGGAGRGSGRGSHGRDSGGGVEYVVDFGGWDGVVGQGFVAESELGQVLVNLYMNAVRGIEDGAMLDGSEGAGSGGVVGVRAFADEDGFGVVVEDSGVGFGGSGGNGGNGDRAGERAVDRVGDRGHGLGLGICVELCSRFGVEIRTGTSERLGGGLVRLYKQYK